MAQKTKVQTKTEAVTKKGMNMRDNISARAKDARAAADHGVKRSREEIQKRPLTAVGAGVAAGAAVGLIAAALVSRRRAGKKRN
jgi:ElaB/YqjD/DUF883 family membrane-anchored ribosome-binding protein